MKSIFVSLLAIADFAVPTPVQKAHQVENRNFWSQLESAAVDIPILAKKQIGALPSPSAPLPSTPIANAALWQEAINNDAAVATPGASNAKNNQGFYQLIAFVQSQENSSLLQSDSGLNAADTSAFVSETLQGLQMYPTRFDLAQASNPATSIS